MFRAYYPGVDFQECHHSSLLLFGYSWRSIFKKKTNSTTLQYFKKIFNQRKPTMNNILSNTMRLVAIGLLSAVFMSASAAQEEMDSVDVSKMKQSATLTFEGRAYNMIIGGTWGHGNLTYKGKQYRFRAKSVGAGYAVGVKDVEVKGVVYNLNSVDDFAGTYWGVKAAGTAFVGVGASNIQNSRGVVISAKSNSTGVAVDIAAGLARIVIDHVEK